MPIETATQTNERTIKTCEACGKEYTPKNKNRTNQQTCSYACRDALRARHSNFWDRVEQGAGCWIWKGTKTSYGYGVVERGGRKIGAHRVAYEMTHGAIPGGLEVCHACDNPSCVNPDHLFLGTHGDNMRDMCRKNRHNKPKGEESGRARLTNQQVLDIRSEYADESTSYRRLAQKYGVGKNTVGAIVSRRSWRHI